MKLHYTNAFIVAGLLAAMPAHAADAKAGKSPAASCFASSSLLRAARVWAGGRDRTG